MCVGVHVETNFTAPTWQLPPICYYSTTGSGGLFWPPQALNSLGTQTYIQAKYTEIK